MLDLRKQRPKGSASPPTFAFEVIGVLVNFKIETKLQVFLKCSFPLSAAYDDKCESMLNIINHETSNRELFSIN